MNNKFNDRMFISQNDVQRGTRNSVETKSNNGITACNEIRRIF